jgi:hypothetical protein
MLFPPRGASVGGKLVEKVIPNNTSLKRADYLFRSPLVIAELKCLEEEFDRERHKQQIEKLMKDWQRRGLIRVFGMTTIELQKLPKPCQNEWLELFEGPLQKHIFSDANKQIRDTKQYLSLPKAKGILLIANEARTFLTPSDLMGCFARILKKQKSDGQFVFSNIHHIVLFSVNMKVKTRTYPDGIFHWIPGFRIGENNPEINNFLTQLGASWFKFNAKKRNASEIRLKQDGEPVEGMEYLSPSE